MTDKKFIISYWLLFIKLHVVYYDKFLAIDFLWMHGQEFVHVSLKQLQFMII